MEVTISRWFVRSARDQSRRGKGRNRRNEREERRQRRCGDRSHRGSPEDGGRRENESGISDDDAGSGITGAHRTVRVRCSGCTHSAAISFVPLEVALLAMMKRTVDGVAARRQRGRGKCLRKHRHPWEQQRQEGGACGESAEGDTQLWLPFQTGTPTEHIATPRR